MTDGRGGAGVRCARSGCEKRVPANRGSRGSPVKYCTEECYEKARRQRHREKIKAALAFYNSVR
jgi:hypothetical protein